MGPVVVAHVSPMSIATCAHMCNAVADHASHNAHREQTCKLNMHQANIKRSSHNRTATNAHQPVIEHTSTNIKRASTIITERAAGRTTNRADIDRASCVHLTRTKRASYTRQTSIDRASRAYRARIERAKNARRQRIERATREHQTSSDRVSPNRPNAEQS